MHFNIFCKKPQLTCQSISITFLACSYGSNKSEKYLFAGKA